VTTRRNFLMTPIVLAAPALSITAHTITEAHFETSWHGDRVCYLWAIHYRLNGRPMYICDFVDQDGMEAVEIANKKQEWIEMASAKIVRAHWDGG